jgi:hypothetical protein
VGQLIPGHPVMRVRHRAARCGREQRGGKVWKKGRGEADKPVPQVSERQVKGGGAGELGCGSGWAGPAGVKEGLEIGPRPDLKLWKKVDARFRFRV